MPRGARAPVRSHDTTSVIAARSLSNDDCPNSGRIAAASSATGAEIHHGWSLLVMAAVNHDLRSWEGTPPNKN